MGALGRYTLLHRQQVLTWTKKTRRNCPVRREAHGQPSVIIRMDPPRYVFAALPADEHGKAFHVLVSVFSAADTRRRQTYCKGACGHAWHNLPPR
ncbi:DUF5958 family protein [Streptomyces bobili]